MILLPVGWEEAQAGRAKVAIAKVYAEVGKKFMVYNNLQENFINNAYVT